MFLFFDHGYTNTDKEKMLVNKNEQFTQVLNI
jgi:hypothetical protein